MADLPPSDDLFAYGTLFVNLEAADQGSTFGAVVSEALFKQDDRSSVLVGVAWLDEQLSRTLRAYLMPGKSTDALLEGARAPLGTFSAKIHACHALGLISDENHKTLELLRKIRNEFAHDWNKLTCESPGIIDRIGHLPKHPWGTTPKRQFGMTVITLHAKLLFISGLYQKAAENGRKPGVSELEPELRDFHDRITSIRASKETEGSGK